jgi:nucleotide-binding universal stress UspA family protein
VVELHHTPFKPGGLTSPLDVESGLREKGEEALTGMLGDSPGDVAVTDGGIASEILVVREKLQADLVVMGRRGLTGVKRFLVGSVMEKVARFCEVPVWVVK